MSLHRPGDRLHSDDEWTLMWSGRAVAVGTLSSAIRCRDDRRRLVQETADLCDQWAESLHQLLGFGSVVGVDSVEQSHLAV